MRVFYEEMKEKLQSILVKYGFDEKRAEESAKNFADSSLDGVYSHGYQRFPRVIDYIQKGYIDVNAVPEKITGFGAVERWDGHLGMGNLNAKMAMQRAVELAAQLGIGMVAMSNTNHWMRGGAYGWQAAEAGCIGICWTNTCPNMPAWGAIDGRIGNNPFVLAVPDQNGEHVVVDTAMAQYSYGKLSVCRQNGEKLPYPGGYDEEGSLTCDPAAIEKTRRVVPIGYWKGSGDRTGSDRRDTHTRKNCDKSRTGMRIGIRPDAGIHRDPPGSPESGSGQSTGNLKRDTERYPGFHSGKRRTYRPISRTGNTHPTQGKSEERNPGQRGNMEKDM